MEKYVNRSYCRPINENVAMLAYSDSVCYYGQYTEAGSGSFLGATNGESYATVDVTLNDL